MSVGKVVTLYGICVAAFFLFDLIWLSSMMKPLYQPQLGSLLAEKPKFAVAAIFYLLYVVGIVALAVIPGVREGSLVAALWRGALFGFLAYATYDLTNWSTLRDWPAMLSVIDMIWGTTLSSAVTAVGYFAATRFLGLG